MTLRSQYPTLSRAAGMGKCNHLARGTGGAALMTLHEMRAMTQNRLAEGPMRGWGRAVRAGRWIIGASGRGALLPEGRARGS